MKDPDYKYKVLMRKVRDEKEKNEHNNARGGGGGGGGGGRGSSRSSKKSSSRPSSNRSAVQRDRMQHRKHKKSQMPAWAATEERSDTASTCSSSMTIGESVRSESGAASFRVTNWTDSEGSRAGGESSSLNEWGMHQQVPNQLPPIGL